jgi:hypothetical protein
MLKAAGNTPPQTPHPHLGGEGGAHPAQAWIEGLLAAIGAARGAGRQGKWQCPVHGRVGAHTVALGVGTRTDQTGAWVYCHAGCSAYDILRDLGLTMAHLRHPPPVPPERHVHALRLKVGFPAPKAGSGSPRELGYKHEAFHDYGDRFRKERLRHPVTGVKTLQWEARNHRGEWVPDLLGTREADLPLYRERDVVKGIALGETVLLVESESSVDALTGWYATTWAGGASSPPLDTLARVLGTHDRIVVIADADDAGRRCAAQLRTALPLSRIVQSDVDGEDARDLYTRLGPTKFTAAITDVLTGMHP